MIYTVSFNPSLDYILDISNFDTGKVNRVSAERIFPGGKGINVSIVLNNLGIDNRALGFVAGFTGEVLEKFMKDKGVDTDFIHLQEGMTRINVKLRSDEETEINGKGPVIGEQHMKALYEKLDVMKDNDILVLAGSIPDSVPKSVYMDIMQRLKDRDIKIVVDATRELLVNVLPHKPFLIKPNNHELGDIFDTEIKHKDAVIRYGKKLMERGARNVLVSMAGDGAVLLAEDGRIYQAEAPKGELKNSVGAGDSMVAGFIAGYIESGNYERAFQSGVCTGSASAFSEELATREAVETLMRENF